MKIIPLRLNTRRQKTIWYIPTPMWSYSMLYQNCRLHKRVTALY